MNLSFPEACARIYERELRKSYDKEIAVESYLPQEAFDVQCRARGKALSYGSEIAVDNFKGLCIALHREKHGDNVEEEKIRLIESMPEEDVQLAEDGIGTYGWWKD